jgi:NitT/TauT family transport system permease protein
MKNLFKMGHVIASKNAFWIEISGLIFFIGLWFALTNYGAIPSGILPNPLDVLKSFAPLYSDNALVGNTVFSIKLNLWGYLEAVIVTIPLAFLLGLFPFFKHLLSRYVDAIRFLPLTAVTGIFIAWFGIGFGMKVHFLSFGIIVYLLPIAVQRIMETEQVYVDTVWTLGASNWQIFKNVYFPSVMSKLFDDIRVIVSISWTYIIVAELVNSEEGGIGSMIYLAARQSRMDKLFALLIVIILIGFIQDKIFKWLDSALFKFKYASLKNK